MRRNRLDEIIKFVDKGSYVIDIGTDHGLTLKKLFDANIISKAIAADLREGPLSQAKENLANYNVKFYLSDGFKSILDKTFDTAIISGMGSHLITNILDENAKKDILLILQPNDKEERLREYLSNNWYKIIDETVLYDKHYYVIIKAIYEEAKLSEEDIYVGPILKTKKESLEYYKYKRKHLNNLLKHVDNVTKEDFKSKIKVLDKVIKTLK